MKVSVDSRRKLIAACEGQPLSSVIDDACELLTLKVMLFIKKRTDALRTSLNAQPVGSPERAVVAATINTLHELYVALAEAP